MILLGADEAINERSAGPWLVAGAWRGLRYRRGEAREMVRRTDVLRVAPGTLQGRPGGRDRCICLGADFGRPAAVRRRAFGAVPLVDACPGGRWRALADQRSAVPGRSALRGPPTEVGGTGGTTIEARVVPMRRTAHCCLLDLLDVFGVVVELDAELLRDFACLFVDHG